MTATATPAIDLEAIRAAQAKSDKRERDRRDEIIAKLASGELTYDAESMVLFLADYRMTPDELDAEIKTLHRKAKLIAALEHEKQYGRSLSLRAALIKAEFRAREREREAENNRERRACDFAEYQRAQVTSNASDARIQLSRDFFGWQEERPDLRSSSSGFNDDPEYVAAAAATEARRINATKSIGDWQDRGDMLSEFPHPLDESVLKPKPVATASQADAVPEAEKVPETVAEKTPEAGGSTLPPLPTFAKATGKSSRKPTTEPAS